MFGRLVSFNEALGPLFIFSKLVGLSVLDSKLRFSKLMYLYSLCLGISVGSYGLYRVISWTVVKSDFLKFTHILSQIVLLTSWAMFYIKSLRYKEFSQAINKLRKSAVEGVRIPWLTYTPLVLKFFQAVCLVIISQKKLQVVILDITYYELSRSPVIVLPMQFSAFNEVTTDVLRGLEVHLSTLYLERTGNSLCRHLEICEYFRTINRYYSPSVLVSLVFMFCTCPPFFYSATKNIIQGGETTLVFFITETFLTLYVVLVLVTTSNRLRKQVSRFNQKVNEQARYYDNFMEIDKVTLYIQYNPKLVPSCGTFKLTYSLVIKLCATCVTYVIILLQFVSS